MKRLQKRALSLFLALVMTVSLLPTGVWAAGATVPAEIPTWIQEKIDSIPEIGSYTKPGWQAISDSDLFYYPLMRSEIVEGHMVTDTIVFIAPGDGASAEDSSIPNYGSITESPWGESTVSALYIADGVTGVGNHAFDGMSTLTTLEIENPSKLTAIGEYAFRGCDKLVFTEDNPLSLPNLESLGQYAFNGCERLGYVELGGSLTEIPQHAFNNAGLRDIEIPASVTKIGDYAFANNNFSNAGELVLPEGLEAIGSHAFYRNLATGTTSGFTSITIPSAVKTIGDYAFYNHRRLETVTVNATAANGFTPPGHAAFGTAPTDGSYSETVDITVDNITYKNVSTGTQFLTQDMATADLFVSGENCFLGNLEPLKFEKTKAPTCTEAGYDRYTLTIKNVTQDGQPVTMNVDFPIEKVGHNHVRQPVTRPATCENPEYYVDLCMNEENGLVPEGSCKEPEKLTPVDLEEKGALGHKYQQSGIENPKINGTNTAPTKITYTCIHYSEVEGKNLHDGRYAPSYVWSIPATTLHASTSNKLSDLTLPTPTGDGNTIPAKLEWAEGVDTTSLLEADSHDYQVKLVVTGSGAFPEYTDETFTIRVQVEKVKLDFSQVEFKNAVRFTGQTNPDFAVTGLPEGIIEESITIEYSPKGEDNWTTIMPDEANPDDAAKYDVRITFSYEGDKYLLVETDPDLLPPDEYTLIPGEGNTATITGDYIVRSLTEADLEVSAVPDLTYQKDTEQNVIQVEGVPAGSTVTATWEENNVEQTDTVIATSTTVFIAGITNAGTYPVTVTVAHATAITDGSVTLDPVNGTIAKRTVTTPTANTDLEEYTPGVSQTGVPASTDASVYTVTDNIAIDAGTHTATAELVDKNNYQWSSGDDNNDGKVSITYTIPKRRVTVPSIPMYNQSIEYDGHPHTPLRGYNTTALKVAYDDATGTLTASYQGETVFTATNAKRTDADEYEVTVSLNNADGKKNYVWSSGSDADLTLKWEITPKQIAAPIVDVKDATYTAEPYDAANNITITGENPEKLTLGNNHTYFNPSSLGDTELGYVPIDAGSYRVEIDFVFPEGEKASNYDITGTTRYKFEITKAELTVNYPTQREYTYTGAAQAIDGVTVSGVLEGEQSNPPYTLAYTSQTWDESLNEGKGGWSTSTTNHPDGVKLTNVGKYLITPAIVSKNYQAAIEPIEPYEVTITEAKQTIKLTADQDTTLNGAGTDESPYTVTKTLGDAPFTVTGQGYVGTNQTSANITYESSAPDTASVDTDTGKVTLHKATGEGASVTITVKAAADDSGNYGEATATYTLTVGKATPTIDVSKYTNNKFETEYTGKLIEGYDKATLTGAGNGADDPSGTPVYTFYEDAECNEKFDDGAGGNIPIAVGGYYLKITYGGDSNYTAATPQVIPVTVTQAEVGDVTVQNYNEVYNGKDNSLSGSVTGVNGFDKDDYTVQYIKTTDGSTPTAQTDGWSDDVPVKDVSDSTSTTTKYWYKVTIDGGNHAPKIGEIKVTISPAELTVGGVPGRFSKTYDSTDGMTEDLRNITVTGVGEDQITVSNPTGKYETEDAGSELDVTIELTLSGVTEWGNYKYNGAAPTEGKLTVTKEDAGTITKKEITVTGISATDGRVYNGGTNVTLTGTPATTDMVEGDSLTLTLDENATGTVQDSTTGANDAADVGNGKAVTVLPTVITLGGEDAGNYEVTAVKDADGRDITVDITPRPVTLEFVGIDSDRVITKPYTGDPVNVAVEPAEDQGEDAGFVGGDHLKTEDVVYTYSPEGHTAVGDYTVTAALKNPPTGIYDNYELKFPTDTTTLRITNTTGVSVDAKDYTGEYTGQPHGVTDKWEYHGYVDDTVQTVQFIKKDADHQTAPGTDADWQNITFEDVSQSGDYWWKVTAPSHEPVVGTSTVRIEITPLALTVTPTLTREKVYDGTPNFDPSKITSTEVAGEADNETITATPGTASYDEADAGERTITIPYTLTGAELSNYTYDSKPIPADGKIEVKETGRITPKEITVTIKDKTKPYDGVAPTVTSNKDADWTVDDGAIVGQDDLKITLSIANSEGKADVGTYNITGTAGNGNYTVTFQGYNSKETYGVYTVTARPITVDIGDTSGFYGDAPDMSYGTDKITLTDKNSDLVKDENIYSVLTGLELTTNATSASDVDGTYTISAENGNGQYGNYQVTFNEGAYTVKQRPITITLTDQSSYYGADPHIAQDAYTISENDEDVVNADLQNGLTITLSVSKDGSAINHATPAGVYDIVPAASGNKVKNYDITWEGSGNPFDDGQYGKYTVEKAELKIEYPGNNLSVAMGGSVSWPLSFYNVSNSNSKLDDKPADVTLTYTSSKEGVAEVDADGNVTIKSTGQTTIQAEITNFGANYKEGTKIALYVLTVVQGGQGIQVDVQPNTLTYTGETQELVTTRVVYPTDSTAVTVKYRLNATTGEYTEGIPTGINAGTYTVYWEASASGLATIYGSETVTIQKANPSTGFTPSSVSTEYAEGKVFDSTSETKLNIHSKYESESGAKITYLSSDTMVAKVTENDLSKIALNGTGTVRISAEFAETDNFNAQTVSFTLTVNQAGTTIQFKADSYEVEYNGQPHGAKIEVQGLTNYTIKYSDDNGTSYDLEKSPTVTDVTDGPLTICFQIQADGYPSQIGTQTVTVTPKELEEDMVSGIAESYTFTNRQITPESELILDGTTHLVKGKDYNVTYGTNKDVGSSKDDEELTNGGGWVKFTGTGNYKGEVTKYFAITAVAGSLTASLDRYYGTYGDANTNHATVTVYHNLPGSSGHDVAADEITVTVLEGPTDGAQVNGTEVTFTELGTYKLQVEVEGTHSGTFTLLYALLPAASADGLTLTVGGEPTPAVSTYGDKVDGDITVTSDGTDLNADAYTLTYSYQPFAGNGAVSAGTPYEANTVFGDSIPAAGLYVVTATAKEGSGYTGSGSFVFLVQQKNLDETMLENIGEQTYNGSAIEPDVTVTYNGEGTGNLILAQDYEVSYQDNTNAGTAKAIVTAKPGSNNFTGTASREFTIAPKSIADQTVTIETIPDQSYTGGAIIPALTIQDNGKALLLGRDYTVSCEDNSNVGPGEATLTIKGIGNYKDSTAKTFTITPQTPTPVTGLELTVTPNEWTYNDGTTPKISVTYDGSAITHYTLAVEKDGQTVATDGSMEQVVAALVNPGTYTITANGTGVYAGVSDTATVTIHKIQPTVTVTASPTTLSNAGTVTLTLSGTALPAGTELKTLLSAAKKDGSELDLSKLTWTQGNDGTWTAELSLPNADETYTFTLTFNGDGYYEAAKDTAQVVTARHTSSGGGGGGGSHDDTPVWNGPDSTGVSDWLNTDDHGGYLSGYPDGAFGPDRSMTRAEVAQMFYALLRDKDGPITVTFTDVGEGAWYHQAVNVLASLGMVSGVGDGRFEPDRPVTRAEFTAIAAGFARLEQGGATRFTDVHESDWYYHVVSGCARYGWISGYADNTFRPNNPITRAEVTVIVNNMLGRTADWRYIEEHEEALLQFSDLTKSHWAYYQIMEAVNAHRYDRERDGGESWSGLA